MSKQDIVDELHRSVRRNFLRRCTIIKGIDDLWQADLIDLQKYAHLNRGYKYVLVIIDAFSKYVWIAPLKTKSKECVTKAMQKILTDVCRKPDNLQTDFGKEFYNESFQKLMKYYKINHYSTYSVKKASIVERVIKTLKCHLYKLFSLVGEYVWLGNNFDSVVRQYNRTLHKTTKFKPIDINQYNQEVVKANIIKTQQRQKEFRRSIFNIGDKVRISKYKGDFYKGYTPNWSTEIFTVIKVNNTNPLTYQIEDQHKQRILGSFYGYELQKTKNPDFYLIEKVIKRKGTKFFVKWLGLGENENSWIEKSALLQ